MISKEITELQKLAELALNESLSVEMSANRRSKACYDAAAYCALAVAKANGRELREREWSSLLSYLVTESISSETVHSVNTLSQIHANSNSSAWHANAIADVCIARKCAMQIHKDVDDWLTQSTPRAYASTVSAIRS